MAVDGVVVVRLLLILLAVQTLAILSRSNRDPSLVAGLGIFLDFLCLFSGDENQAGAGSEDASYRWCPA